MIKGIYQAARGLYSGDKHIGVVANNLANLNTTGFKKELPFHEIMDAEGNYQVKQFTDFKQGELLLTSNPLDMAIKGDGFFAVQTDKGIELTRDGKFAVSEEGYLVNNKGFKVLGRNGEIAFEDSKFNQDLTVTISKEGEIKVGETVLDELLIVNSDNPQFLEKSDNAYFTDPQGNFNTAESGRYEVIQGFLETSNVSPIEEMENMIRMNKDYESAQKIVRYLDESLERANQIGKV